MSSAAVELSSDTINRALALLERDQSEDAAALRMRAYMALGRPTPAGLYRLPLDILVSIRATLVAHGGREARDVVDELTEAAEPVAIHVAEPVVVAEPVKRPEFVGRPAPRRWADPPPPEPAPPPPPPPVPPPTWLWSGEQVLVCTPHDPGGTLATVDSVDFAAGAAFAGGYRFTHADGHWVDGPVTVEPLTSPAGRAFRVREAVGVLHAAAAQVPPDPAAPGFADQLDAVTAAVDEVWRLHDEMTGSPPPARRIDPA